jgi:peroxiredoxin
VTRRQQWLAVAALVATVGGGLWAGVTFSGGRIAQVAVGSRAPGFHAVTVDSVPVARTLADYRGRVLLVNIWATWCPPCEREMPMLQRLYEEYHSKGLALAAVSMDTPGMEDAIRDFITRYSLTFDVLYDSKGDITRDYMTTGAPVTFVIGKNGVIRYIHLAAITDSDAMEIRALLDRLLVEPTS